MYFTQLNYTLSQPHPLVPLVLKLHKFHSLLIFTCNCAGFCSIQEKLISGQFWCSHGEIKQAMIFSQIEQKPARLHVYYPWPSTVFLETKISWPLRNFFHAWKHTHTIFPHLGDHVRTPSKVKFLRGFVMHV